MQTMTQKLVAGLLAIGCREVVSPSRKYRAFEAETLGKVYFVGRAGALRSNTSLKVTGSVSLDRTVFKRKVQQYGEVDHG